MHYHFSYDHYCCLKFYEKRNFLESAVKFLSFNDKVKNNNFLLNTEHILYCSKSNKFVNNNFTLDIYLYHLV